MTIRDCHILFAFYNVGKAGYNCTGVRAVELDTEQGRSQEGSWCARDPPFCKPFSTKHLEQVAKMPWRFSLKMSKQTSTLALTHCHPPFEKSWLRLCRELKIYGCMLKLSSVYGKCGNFMLLFCRGWHELDHKSVPHVQHAYFSSLNQSKFYINLWRCCCRSRHRC